MGTTTKKLIKQPNIMIRAGFVIKKLTHNSPSLILQEPIRVEGSLSKDRLFTISDLWYEDNIKNKLKEGVMTLANGSEHIFYQVSVHKMEIKNGKEHVDQKPLFTFFTERI